MYNILRYVLDIHAQTKDDGGLRADQKWHSPSGVPTKIHLWSDTCLLSGCPQ